MPSFESSIQRISRLRREELKQEIVVQERRLATSNAVYKLRNQQQSFPDMTASSTSNVTLPSTLEVDDTQTESYTDRITGAKLTVELQNATRLLSKMMGPTQADAIVQYLESKQVPEQTPYLPILNDNWEMISKEMAAHFKTTKTSLPAVLAFVYTSLKKQAKYMPDSDFKPTTRNDGYADLVKENQTAMQQQFQDQTAAEEAVRTQEYGSIFNSQKKLADIDWTKYDPQILLWAGIPVGTTDFGTLTEKNMLRNAIAGIDPLRIGPPDLAALTELINYRLGTDDYGKKMLILDPVQAARALEPNGLLKPLVNQGTKIRALQSITYFDNIPPFTLQDARNRKQQQDNAAQQQADAAAEAARQQAEAAAEAARQQQEEDDNRADAILEEGVRKQAAIEYADKQLKTAVSAEKYALTVESKKIQAYHDAKQFLDEAEQDLQKDPTRSTFITTYERAKLGLERATDKAVKAQDKLKTIRENVAELQAEYDKLAAPITVQSAPPPPILGVGLRRWGDRQVPMSKSRSHLKHFQGRGVAVMPQPTQSHMSEKDMDDESMRFRVPNHPSLFVCLKNLQRGSLAVRYSTSKLYKISPTQLSEVGRMVVQELLFHDKFNRPLYDTLKDDEKRKIEQLIQIMGKDGISGYNGPESLRELWQQFTILRGEIEAGNNAPRIKASLRKAVVELMQAKRLSKSDGQAIITGYCS